MWVFRELTRLLMQIAVVVLVAIVIAEAKAVIGGGDAFHTFKITSIALGAFLLLLGAMGNGGPAARRVNYGIVTPGRGGRMSRAVAPRPGDPTLSATAVLIAGGLIMVALGIVA
ncbi:MAG TPA: hypothetical protein VGH52_03210 [Gaiellaceae bacterium]|jgi:hypothetical protein